MHGFNLVLGSILAFPWAQRLLVSAQRLVTFFRASHMPLALLRQAAQRFGITRGLHSSNKTRFTSKHECISSVVANHPAFQYVLTHHRVNISNEDVIDIIKDTSFWGGLSMLNKLLTPLTEVIVGVQSNHSTLADICRCEAGCGCMGSSGRRRGCRFLA